MNATQNPLYKCGFLTLIGLPNAGKSSLMNWLVGETLAIVTPKAQTTRKVSRGFLRGENFECIITDTPGLHEGTRALNAIIAKNAIKALGGAISGREQVAFVVDSIETLKQLERNEPLRFSVLKTLLERDSLPLPLNTCVLPVINKADLVKHPPSRKRVEAAVTDFLRGIFSEVAECCWVSSHSQEGREPLIEHIASRLSPGAPGELFDADSLGDTTVRELTAEYVREQCFMQLGAEIPYSIAVSIDQFDESDAALTRIQALVSVEKESQKGIVIGAGGLKLKSIGTKARAKIETLLQKKVYLGIKVTVVPQWAAEEKWVKRFGYENR